MIRNGTLYLKYIVKSDATLTRWQITIKDMNTQKFLCQNLVIPSDAFANYNEYTLKDVIPERVEAMVHKHKAIFE